MFLSIYSNKIYIFILNYFIAVHVSLNKSVCTTYVNHITSVICFLFPLPIYCFVLYWWWIKNQTVNDGVAHSKNPRKCAYHVTFDLDLDLEHTLDACWPWIHLVKVWWRSGHLCARRSDLRKSLQTDRQTDDGRRAIALAHSWNELKTVQLLSTPSPEPIIHPPPFQNPGSATGGN